MAVLAPMPSASVSTATIVNAGDFLTGAIRSEGLRLLFSFVTRKFTRTVAPLWDRHALPASRDIAGKERNGHQKNHNTYKSRRISGCDSEE